MAKQFRASLVRPFGWGGGNQYTTRFIPPTPYHREGRYNNSSGYRGVYFEAGKKRYRACISVDNKTIHLGYFDDPADGGRAYDEAAKKYHGADAVLNFGSDDTRYFNADVTPGGAR